MLWLTQRILFGTPDAKKSEGLTDINWREFAYLAPLIALVFVMGLYPKIFFDRMEPSILEFTKRVSAPAPAAEASLRKGQIHAQHD